MIRMVLLLMFGIGATMVFYGNDNGLPQGSDDGGPDISQTANNEPGLLTRVGALIENTGPDIAEDERVPLKDESRAVEIALAATVAHDTPAVAPAPEVEVSTAGAPPKEADLWYVTGTRVNLRGGPSTADSVVGQVVRGQEAEVIEETDDGWYHIRTADDGQDGFIFGKFLSQNRPG